MTTWRRALAHATTYARDPGPVLAYAPDEVSFDIEFDGGYSTSANGPPVLAWTETRVYFSIQYDGSEWLGSAPRNPQAEGQQHVGGTTGGWLRR